MRYIQYSALLRSSLLTKNCLAPPNSYESIQIPMVGDIFMIPLDNVNFFFLLKSAMKNQLADKSDKKKKYVMKFDIKFRINY
jgi:hypothetical protein